MLQLPMPPSTNKIWKPSNDPERRMRKAPQYRQFRKECGEIIMANGPRPECFFPEGDLAELVELDINRRANLDVDNRLKALNDVLEKCNIIGNDHQFVDARIRWANTGDVPCLVRVWPVGYEGDETRLIKDPRL